MVAHARKKWKAMRRAEFKHSFPTIRRDDKVQIIAGDDSGKVGKVMRVLVARERVVVEGANIVFRHVKKSPKYPQGGRVEREAAIHVSNVLLYCEKCGKGRRAGRKVDGETKSRVCKECGTRFGG